MLTMESDRFIAVREKAGEQMDLIVIDLNDPSNILRKTVTADSTIMHRDEKILALKSGGQLQVFDLDKKTKLKSHLMNEEVNFWRWLGPSTIGLVTPSTIYNWNIDSSGSSSPQRVFERHECLAGCQIINYRTDSTGRWSLVVGISAVQGRVVGAIQLYNVDKGASQAIEGHAAGFAEVMLEGARFSTKLFILAVRTATAGKLQIIEIDHREGNPTYQKRVSEIIFPPEAASDFPVSLQIDNKHEAVYVVTKFGFLHIYDLITGACIFSDRISGETIFVTTEYRAASGLMGVNRKGQVLSVALDESTLVPYCMNQLGNVELALRLASKNNLPGADELFVTRFDQLMHSGAYGEAAKLAARSPKGLLRTPETINALKAVVVSPGQSSPLLQYFTVLLETNQLNEFESIELAKPVLAQGKKNLLETWLNESKITPSEALGDIMYPTEPALALLIYMSADVPDKVCLCLAQLGQFSKLMTFTKKRGYSPNWKSLLETCMQADPAKAVEFGQLLLADESLGVDAEEIFDLFVSQSLIQQATSSVVERLKSNSDSVSGLQTKVLRLNLQQAPQVADAILKSKLLNRYDRREIAGLCEMKGLYQGALEHYTEAEDIVRVLMGTTEGSIDLDWIVGYFRANVSTEEIVKALRTLMAQDASRFVQLTITVGVKLVDKITPSFIMEIFSSMGNEEGMFIFTGALLPSSSDPAVHLAYIKAATRTGKYRDVERICKESSRYDPQAVWAFLTSEELPDPLPLIVVADRFNLVHDLVLHLYQKGLTKHIEVYVQKVNPMRTPEVAAALLDCGCEHATVQGLLESVPTKFSLDALVEVLGERNALPLLLPFLERKIKSENSRDPAVYNALAKIYVMKRADHGEVTVQFLQENNLYDTRNIGLFCEAHDPQLALIAFTKGHHDRELIEMTGRHGMFKEQARYLLIRKDPNLWRSVLQPSTPVSSPTGTRASLLDALVNSSVLDDELVDAEGISIAVKAIMGIGNLGGELAAVLEKIIYGGKSYSENRNLQNLLLSTTIKTSSGKVMDHLHRLRSYDGGEIAKQCAQAGLFEEAFFAYKKAGNLPMAMSILVDNIQDYPRSQGFAEDCNDREVWKALGKGLLRTGGPTKFGAAVEAFIRAEDASDYPEVIRAASTSSSAGQYAEDLLRYLQMARRKTRDATIDNELFFSLALLHRLADMEEFLAHVHAAQLQQVADRCFQAQLWEAARLLYGSISNFAKLATTLVHLRDYSGAVENAKRANNLRVWADVQVACLETGEYSLAQVCGLHLVVHTDEIDNLVYVYESKGLYAQCLALLEGSLGLERLPNAVYTELAIQYSRHRPEQLADYIQRYGATRLNVPKVANACAESHLWSEMAILLFASGDHERALNTMLEHPMAWSHDRFCSALVHCATPDTMLRSLRFYLTEAPLLASDMLVRVGTRVDPTRIVEFLRKENILPLVKGYLTTVQPLHSIAVNTALNEVLLAEEDLEALKTSLAISDKYEVAPLASKLSQHPRIEFRRLAAQLYRHHKMWREAVGLFLSEGLYRDALSLAAESKDRAVVEDLIRELANQGKVHLFLGACYAGIDSVPVDVMVELAWRRGWMDLIVPFQCQALKEVYPDSRISDGVGGSGVGGGALGSSRSGPRPSFGTH